VNPFGSRGNHTNFNAASQPDKPLSFLVSLYTYEGTLPLAEIANSEAQLTKLGEIVSSEWQLIASGEHEITDTFIVMPNYLQGITNVNKSKLNAFQEKVARIYNDANSTSGAKFWSKTRTTIHPIYGQEILLAVRDYLTTKPQRWLSDPENPVNKTE
jgi:hypothetical protein